MSQSILTNTGIATAGRVLNLLLGVAVIAIVTRRLGPTRFGEYTVVLAYGIILQLVADFGLYLTLTRELAQTTRDRTKYIAQVISLRATLLVVIFLIGGLVLQIGPGWRTTSMVFMVAAVGLFFQSISQLLMGVYQAEGVVWQATVADIVGRLAQVLTVVVVSTSTLSMIAAFTVGTLLTLLIQAWLLPIRSVWYWAYDRTVWRRLLKISWPLGLMLVMNAIYFRIDAVILAYWRSPAEVGQYGLAYKVVESALFFPAMFGGLLLPAISAALKESPSRTRAQQLLNQSLHFLIVVALVTLLLLQQGATWLVTWLSGPGFTPAAPLLQILALALAIMFLGNLFGYVLVALERQKTLLGLYVGLAIGNTIANWVLVPTYGAVAAAWVTVVTEGIAMGVAGLVVHQSLRLRIPLQLAVRMAVVIGGTLLITYVLPDAWPMSIRLGVILISYSGLSFGLGVLRWQDLNLLLTRPMTSRAVPLPNEGL